MKIDFHRIFTKQYNKLPQKIQTQFDIRFRIFIQNKYDPILNNHTLSGKYEGYRSINVSGNIRALYKIENNKIIFSLIGSHSELY